MQVAFRRTGERRYAVDVQRRSAPDLTMDPAPGYQDDLPHDLVHFLVEVHWGLRDGIFGQVAGGGNAWTFRLAPTEGPMTRATRRQARRVPRGNRAGGRDIARSEVLAQVVHERWHARRPGVGLPAWHAASWAESGATEAELEVWLALAERFVADWRATPVVAP
ncbi:hypothetical protein [Nocardioides lijunqiniae]|uniref:hypothetical protein n=1 Tax=Nocardioides lijunqiniae TaxID=2760832 RepID=UPI00187754EE|nr:hypothetical protein [Nocardioides lijunqiniae]